MIVILALVSAVKVRQNASGEDATKVTDRHAPSKRSCMEPTQPGV